ncbi:MAG: ATP-binding protein [Pseudomonadota bacterium]
MSEYASLLGDAILRHRARVAEHTARVEAELASKVKSEFISNMSHELRTPLNTVLGFSKILADHGHRKLNEAEIIEYAGLINDAAGHLLSVINDILDISKIQSGRYTLDASQINVNTILEQVVAQHQDQAKEAGLEIFARLPKDLPPVRGDDHKLLQVFNNLISNAIKFTEPGGQVAIDALRLAEDGLAILIRDSGIGMSEEEINIALTPFGQVDGSRTRWREGTGLGLPIAKSLVELHGGKLEIKSIQGRGTEVAVLLPSRHHVSIVQGRELVTGEGVPL